MATTYVAAHGKALLAQAVTLISDGKPEGALRHALSAKLPLMFPEEPWWVKSHVTGTEALARFQELGLKKHGFVDVLVGSTVVEYERNLTASGALDHGHYQLRQYCASLLNEGARPDLLLGILSDTVRWHAFKVAAVKAISEVPGATAYGPDHVVLEQVEECDLSAAGGVEATILGDFLIRNLGREGGRPLSATTLADDLGFGSVFCQARLGPIENLVDVASNSHSAYAAMIKKLWTDFVSYLGGEDAAGAFDKQTYVGELYILTLAKLICANVLSGKGLISDELELRSILDGSFFKARGLPNLVEYDYFGWLNASPYVADLTDVAREMQSDLRAYDFASAPAEDLFGSLMAQLAARSQRLLLGQECTPGWLARKVVQSAVASLPSDQAPRFLDMCCGSGAMVVAVVRAAQDRLHAAGIKPGSQAALSELAAAITAFDIDPLAVMLAKVGWVLASKQWLVAGQELQIPVYHADSLFANTPVTKFFSASGEEGRQLRLDNEDVELPELLLQSARHGLFDALLSRGYAMAMTSARSATTSLKDQDIDMMVDLVANGTASVLTPDERSVVVQFCRRLLRVLEDLQRAGRNGIWAFVLRNSFRPALVAGHFNGVITNPPWLALSKIGSNPYRDALKAKATTYGIKAPGAAHLHVEIATIFLLHAIDRYLSPGAVIACVLPDTVLNGTHHQPFRSAKYLSADRPVPFGPTEIWKVASHTFKNEAIVLFGCKAAPEALYTEFVGREVGPDHDIDTKYYVVTSAGKTVWTKEKHAVTIALIASSSIGPLFRQGADVMPRGVIFHDVKKNGTGWDLGPITAASPLRYLRAKGKVLKNFSITATGVSEQVMFSVLLSAHLAPYELAPGAKGLLPLEFGSQGWEVRTAPALAALGAPTATAIDSALAANGGRSLDQFFDAINTNRKKLTNQSWTDDDWLVLTSAGGKFPCAAYTRANQFPSSTTIIDQTLYWCVVSSEDEAIYMTSMINSPAVMEAIAPLQPRGAFGERHIHKLALNSIPVFDAANPKHIAMVATARALLSEWETRRQAGDIQPYLAAEKSLVVRRARIRSAIEGLPAWTAYKEASAAIYAI